MKVSVCIPVNNEENTIEKTILDVMSQNISISEVIICANGCSDGTINIVKNIQKDNKLIKIITTHIASKCNAWNLLIYKAKENIIIFMDADVTLHDKAFQCILDRQIKTNKTIVGGRMESKKWSIAQYVGYQHFLCGRLYVINKKLFKSYVSEPMPEVLREDYWLELSIPVNETVICQQAYVFYQPPSLYDEYLLAKRMCAGKKQLVGLLRKRNKPVWHNILKTKGIIPKVLFVYGSLYRKIIYIVAKFTGVENKWYRAESTKR